MLLGFGLGMSPAAAALAQAAGSQEKKESSNSKPLSYVVRVQRTLTRDGRRVAVVRLLARTLEQGQKTRITNVSLDSSFWPAPGRFSNKDLIARVQVKKTKADKLTRHDMPIDVQHIRLGKSPDDPVILSTSLRGKDIDADMLSTRMKDYARVSSHFHFLDSSRQDTMAGIIKQYANVQTLAIQPMHLSVVKDDKALFTTPLSRLYISSGKPFGKETDPPNWKQSNLLKDLKTHGLENWREGLETTQRIELSFEQANGQMMPFASIESDNIRAANEAALELFATARQRFEASQGEPSKAVGCMLSTASCTMLGLPDDSWELRTLRQFRDGYLAHSPQATAIEQYYRLSTRLLRSPFAQSHAGRQALAKLYATMVLPCAVLAKLGLNRLCLNLYRRRVMSLLRRSRHDVQPG